MRYIEMERVQPGMMLGRGIYDFSDRNLLSDGKVLTEELIERLMERGYPGVYIEDELSKDIQIQEAISAELRNHAVRSLQDLNIDEAVEVAKKIVEQILESKTVSLDLVDLRSFDDYTYRHSVNVAVLSTVIAMGLGYSHEDLIEICVSAIFHDLGKLLIDKEILNKPGKLSAMENEVMRHHPQMSYDMLAEKWNISAKVRMGALCHHENEDGSGYPNGLFGENIHPFAKIIHVTDVYDALSSKRPYKDACSFSEALEYLMGGCGTLFDKEVVDAFLRYVPVYPKGSMVELSDGREAIVLENSSLNLLRPKLLLMDGDVLDLMEGKGNRSITILRQAGGRVMKSEEIGENEKGRNVRRQHILVVDDMITSLKTVKKVLEKEYQVSLVKSGEQALAFLEKAQPDLILMDIAMPNKNGIETVKEMKEQIPKEIPVIFLSSIRDLHTVLECKGVHAADFIIKPFDAFYLQERVQAVLEEANA
ncbi:MAG: response regulator [Lachnospiraceae bacterium]|nr:response regulator [Lachnospiraceae bacterium]